MESGGRKALCFLCCKKSIPKPKNTDDIHSELEASGDEDNRYKLKTDFVRFFSRYLNVGLSNEDQKVLTEFLSPCDPCSNLIQEFCKLFTSIESLKLQLKAKVGTITETITNAGGDPTRVDAYRKEFESRKNTRRFDKIEAEDGRQMLNQINTLRKKFIKSYQNTVETCGQPQVIFDLIQNPEIPMETSTDNNLQVEEHETLNLEVKEERMDIGMDNEVIIKVEEVQIESEIMTETQEQEPFIAQARNQMDVEIENELIIKHEEVQNESESFVISSPSVANPGPSSQAVSTGVETTSILKRNEVKCEICRQEFTHPFHLRRHMKNSHEKNNQGVPLECSYCPQKFHGGQDQLFQRFRVHMRKAQNLASDIPGDFRCEVCTEKFETEICLKKHKAQFHNPKQKNKNYLRYQVYFRRNFKLARQLRTEQDQFKIGKSCPNCGKICRTVKSLEKHTKEDCFYRNHRKITQKKLNSTAVKLSIVISEGRRENPVHNELIEPRNKVRIEPANHLTLAPPIPVPEPSSHAQPQRLLPSTLSATPKAMKFPKPRVSKCRECGGIFKHPMDLRQHRKNEHHWSLTSLPLECSYCPTTFEQKRPIEPFRKHMNYVHKIRSGLPGELECGVCHEKFENHNAYQLHIERAHNPNLVCEICEKMLDTVKQLEVHKNYWHSNKRSCNMCGVVCEGENALENHLERECFQQAKKLADLRKKSGDGELYELSDDDDDVKFLPS